MRSEINMKILLDIKGKGKMKKVTSECKPLHLKHIDNRQQHRMGKKSSSSAIEAILREKKSFGCDS